MASRNKARQATYLSYSAMDSFSSVSVLARKSTWCSVLPIFRISLAATCDLDWRVANGMNGATEERRLPLFGVLPPVAVPVPPPPAAEFGAERLLLLVGEGVAVPAAKDTVEVVFAPPGASWT